MLDKCEELLAESKHILSLAIGGTAVGTGINAHPEFGNKVANLSQRILDITLYHLKINSMR